MQFYETDELIKQAVIDNDCEEIKRLVSLDGFDKRLQDKALQYACNHPNLHAARYLMNAGARPSKYAVSAACSNGHLELIKMLVEFGEPLYSNQYHCLGSAARNDHVDVVQYYLDQGITAEHLEETFTAACGSKQYRMMDLLFVNGVSLAAMEHKPIYSAVKHGNFDMCGYLLDHVDAAGLLDCKKYIDVSLYIDKDED